MKKTSQITPVFRLLWAVLASATISSASAAEPASFQEKKSKSAEELAKETQNPVANDVVPGELDWIAIGYQSGDNR